MKQLTLLFLLRGDDVLLAMKKRGFGSGRWNGVGGKVEPNETTEQALVRECQEEIRVTPTDFIRVAEIIFEEFDQEMKGHHQVHVYVCRSWEGEPVESEEMAPRWFPVNKLPLHDMWSDDKYWLPQVLSGKTLTASFELDSDDQVVSHNVEETGSWK